MTANPVTAKSKTQEINKPAKPSSLSLLDCTLTTYWNCIQEAPGSNLGRLEDNMIEGSCHFL